MNKRAAGAIQTLVQVVAALCLVALLAMIVHKAVADVSALVRHHPGDAFWLAFLRYVFRNLAGG